MLFTLGNKIYVDSVFKKSFDKAGISYSRFSTQPTIFNNVLWYGVAETEKNYKMGFYSLLDSKPEVDTILTIPKNRTLLNVNHPDIKTLTWFSNGYYNLAPKDSSKNIQYLDLRYPLLNPTKATTSMFCFELKEDGNRWDMVPFSGNRPSKEDLNEFFKRFSGK